MLANIFIYTFFPILMISIVIVIHELGHYWAGRMFGAAARSFSIGFGSTVFSRTDKRGTDWQLNWLPLGGYVNFLDENEPVANDDETKPRPVGKAFYEMNVWQRSVVAVAGPVANFILAIIIFAGFGMVQGNAKSEIKVAEVIEDSAADIAGLKVGDIFVAVNGADARREDRFHQEIKLSAGLKIDMLVLRDGREVELTAVPNRQMTDETLGLKQKAGVLGIRYTRKLLDENKLNPIEAVGYGVDETLNSISSSVRLLGKIISGRESVQTLSGPVGIVNAVGTTAKFSLDQEWSFQDRLRLLLISQLQLCALISVAVGFFNLLPLPVLDGGRLVFNAYEAVTGRLPSERIQAVSMSLTLAFLVGMAIFITIGDFQETGLLEVFRGL
jgi:regulator of sigma E protease